VHHHDNVVTLVPDTHDLQRVAGAGAWPGTNQVDLLAGKVDVREVNRATRVVSLEHIQQSSAAAEDVPRDARELERACLPRQVGVRDVARSAPTTGREQ
jgi:hypothetical protein